MESVRAADGNEGVFRAYWEFATRIHHDRDRSFDPADALRVAALDQAHAAAFSEMSWDDEIRRRMDVGLELAGTDIGTPIIGFEDLNGQRVGIFGPVITRVLPRDQALQLWDGMVAVITVPGFWDGENTFKVRFSPPTIGQWNYRTTSSQPGLNGRTGSFTAIEPTRDNHGPIEIFKIFYRPNI